MADNPKAGARKKALLFLVFLMLIGLLTGGATILLANWHIPARIQAEFTVDRIELALPDGTEPVPVLERATNFKSLTLEHFSRITFSPKQLQIAEASPPIPVNARAHLAKTLQQTADIVLQGDSNRLSSITITGVNEKNALAGRLEAIQAEPGSTVILNTYPGAAHSFTLQLDKISFPPAILPVNPFKLTVMHGLHPALQAASININPVTLEIALRDDNPLIKMDSEAKTWIATLTPANNDGVAFFAGGGTPVKRIEFHRQNDRGGIESALISGEIAYLNFPGKSIAVAQHDFVSLHPLDHAEIKQLRYDPRSSAFHLRMESTVGVIRAGSSSRVAEYRITRLDEIWHDERLKVIFAVVIWVCSTVLTIIKIYREESNRA